MTGGRLGPSHGKLQGVHVRSFLCLAGSCWLTVGCSDDIRELDAERAAACELLTRGPARPLTTTPDATEAPDAAVTVRLDTTITASVGGHAGYLRPEIANEGEWLFALEPRDIPWALLVPGEPEPLLATRTEQPNRNCGASAVIRHYALETDGPLIRLGPTRRTSARVVIVGGRSSVGATRPPVRGAAPGAS